MEQESKGGKEVNYFFLVFLLTLIFGVFLNEFIGLGIIDEFFQMLLLALFLVFSLWKGEFYLGKMGSAALITFAFYTIYSFYIGSNTPRTIILDVVLQAKPFIAFFVVYYSKQRFSDSEKYVLRLVVLGLYFIALLVLVGAMIGSGWRGGFNWFFEHESKYATAVALLSIIYLLTGPLTWKSRLIFLLMLSAGLFSMKGKFFGFYAFAVLFTFLYSKDFLLRISLKNLVLGVVALGLVFLAAKEKILFYAQGFFIQDADPEAVVHNLARPLLYLTSGDILMDYFPFGSGFASFATHASRIDYSSIYSDYGLDIVWGLSEEYSSFVADTHFPSLAQFGWVGVILFVLFWRVLIVKANKCTRNMGDSPAYFSIVLIFVFLMIECVADAAFTNNRGLMSMLLLGYLFNELELKALSSSPGNSIL